MAWKGNCWTVMSFNLILVSGALVGYSYLTNNWVQKGPDVGPNEGWMEIFMTIAHVCLGSGGLLILFSTCSPSSLRAVLLLPASVATLAAGLMYLFGVGQYVINSLLLHTIGITEYGLSTLCTAVAGLTAFVAGFCSTKDFKTECTCCK